MVSDDGRAPGEHEEGAGRVQRHRPPDAEPLQDGAEQQTPARVREARPSSDPSVVGHPALAQVLQGDRIDVRLLRVHEERLGDHQQGDRGDGRGGVQHERRHGRPRESDLQRRESSVPQQRRRHHRGRGREGQHDTDLALVESVVVAQIQREEREERGDRESHGQVHALHRARVSDPRSTHRVSLDFARWRRSRSSAPAVLSSRGTS